MYQEEFRIVKMAEVLQVSRSGYYRWKDQLGKIDPEEKSFRSLVMSIYEEHHGRYGYRRITAEINRRGIKINNKHVYRIMRALGLKAGVRNGTKKQRNQIIKNR